MIELVNVDKYFNRFKKNKVHVIDNTSLKFPKKGLVAILGESGSGKTTLLNVIGGLDKKGKGKVIINGKTYNKCNVDKIRNMNIGYIFQDYKLVDGLSVYDNIALGLKVCGLKDNDEIKKRVDYVLNALNINRLRKRNVLNLSGGERQRVGIARALVKNPNIIICDEPTGNLDSKNTVQIMNIIKKISEEKLVILVTHEVELANFYANRIINIVDGKVVSDVINENKNKLDYRIDNQLFLKDFNTSKSYNINGTKINFYSDEVSNNNIDIVLKNGTLYINSDIKKISDAKEDDIEFINDNRKNVDSSTYQNYDFKVEDFPKKNRSIYHLFSLIRNGFLTILDYSMIKKILLVVYVIIPALVLFAFSKYFGAITYDAESENMLNNERRISVNLGVNLSQPELYDLLRNRSEVYTVTKEKIATLTSTDTYFYQTKDLIGTLFFDFYPVEMLNKDHIILGRAPENRYEIVLDIKCIDANQDENEYALLNDVVKPEDLLNKVYKLRDTNFTIVGFVDENSYNGYFDYKLYNNITKNQNSSYYETYSLTAYEDYQNSIKLTRGRFPTNDYEVIVNEGYMYEYPMNYEIKDNSLKINNHYLKVVGYYKSNDDDNFYTNYDTSMLEISDGDDVTSYDAYIYSSDIDSTIMYLKAKRINAVNIKEEELNYYTEAIQNDLNDTITFSLVLFIIATIILYVLSRSMFLHKIKEIGIYRAIGVKKSDVYKMCLGESLVAITLGSLIGIPLMYYLLYLLLDFLTFIYINIFVVLFSFVVSVLLSILISSIPIFNVIRKYPAEIFTRKDI